MKVETYNIIEIKEGVYLTSKLAGYALTNDIRKAQLFEQLGYNTRQVELTKEWHGEIKKLKITWEVE